ncbi:MAG: hypothetical protein U0Q11_19015 [Vicinamibacterales bacterium]
MGRDARGRPRRLPAGGQGEERRYHQPRDPTVQVGKETRVFKDGEGINFPRNMGVKRTFTLRTVSSSPAMASMHPVRATPTSRARTTTVPP